jgi:hypothetical protein
LTRLRLPLVGLAVVLVLIADVSPLLRFVVLAVPFAFYLRGVLRRHGVAAGSLFRRSRLDP